MEPLLIMRPPCGCCSFISRNELRATWKAAVLRVHKEREREMGRRAHASSVSSCRFGVAS
eukprot:3021225-Pleurochrysis_carterae.AAC.3